MGRSGQASLEYLVFLAAFLSVLLLFAPLISKTYHLGAFGLDARNAKMFSLSVKETLDEFSLLGEGSSRSFSIEPLLEWKISFSEQELVLNVYSKGLGKGKTFSASFSSKVAPSVKTISGKTELVLTKKNGIVSVKYL